MEILEFEFTWDGSDRIAAMASLMVPMLVGLLSTFKSRSRHNWRRLPLSSSQLTLVAPWSRFDDNTPGLLSIPRVNRRFSDTSGCEDLYCMVRKY